MPLRGLVDVTLPVLYGHVLVVHCVVTFCCHYGLTLCLRKTVGSLCTSCMLLDRAGCTMLHVRYNILSAHDCFYFTVSELSVGYYICTEFIAVYFFDVESVYIIVGLHRA